MGSIRVSTTVSSLLEEHFVRLHIARLLLCHYNVINVMFAQFNCNYDELFIKMLLPMGTEAGVDNTFGQQ